MAGRITSLLDPKRITLHVQSTKRTAALNEIARQLEGHPDVANFASFYDELLARDRLDTTCLGNAVALPHARTEHVKKIVMAVGRADTGMRSCGSYSTPSPGRSRIVRSRSSWIFALVRSTSSRTRSQTRGRIAKFEPKTNGMPSHFLIQ